MYRNLLLFIFIIWMHHANAQKNISGRVFDETSKSNLAGASIYVNNSAKGTVTDSKGEFNLVVPSNLEIELVISYLSYYKKVIKIKIGEEFVDKTITLNRKEAVLNQVTIQGKINPKTRKKWLDIFREAFIGKYDHNGNACIIKNPDVIKFDYDVAANELQAYAEVPIIIENIRTKYLISIDLSMFKCNINNGLVQFNYTASFKDLAKPNDLNIKLHRNEYYYSSQMHFLRSLYRNTLSEEGFGVYRLRWQLNEEKKRVGLSIRQRSFLLYENDLAKIDLETLFASKDTVLYYQKVLQQDDYLDGKLEPIDLSKFVNRSTQDSLLQFKPQDTLLIYHIRTTQQLKNRSLPEFHQRIVNQNKIVPHIYKSVMFSYDGRPVSVNSNGKFYTGQLFVEGDMSRKISGLIPDDYQPYQYPAPSQ